MSAQQAERGISHRPEVKGLNELDSHDVERMAQISGGSPSYNYLKEVSGINYQEAYLGLQSVLGRYNRATLDSKERPFSIRTPAVLFAEDSVTLVAPEDYYDDTGVVHRTITLSEGKATVKDVPIDEAVSVGSVIAEAVQVAEEFAASLHKFPLRKFPRGHHFR